jgi:1,4-alpha-glucan branching enzyme
VDNNGDKILAFTRGDLLFVFNFHPATSYTDYGIQCHPGRYNLILDTDDKKYGGFGNIDHSITYFTQRVGGISGSNWLKLYLPPRIGLVFRKLLTQSVYDI